MTLTCSMTIAGVAPPQRRTIPRAAVPARPPHRVLQLHQLNEEVVFGIELGGGHGAFEVEAEPLLNAGPAGALGEIEQEREVEHDRRGEDRVAAEEVDLHLHRIAEPAEEV